jgi:hypothetical protein
MLREADRAAYIHIEGRAFENAFKAIMQEFPEQGLTEQMKPALHKLACEYYGAITRYMLENKERWIRKILDSKNGDTDELFH